MHRMNSCTNHCDSKQPLQRHPLRNPPLLRTRRYAERIWGEFCILVRRTVGKLPVNFSANFDGKFFGLVFLGLQDTQKIHAQNSCPELLAFLSNFTFLNPKFIHGDFLLTGETTKSSARSRHPSLLRIWELGGATSLKTLQYYEYCRDQTYSGSGSPKDPAILEIYYA